MIDRIYDSIYRDWLCKIQSGKLADAEMAKSIFESKRMDWEKDWPDYPNIHRINGINLLQLGKFDDAIKALKKALTAQKEHKFLHFPMDPGEIKDCLMWKDRGENENEEQYEEELLAWTYHDLGLSNAKKSDYLMAAVYYKKAIKLIKNCYMAAGSKKIISSEKAICSDKLRRLEWVLQRFYTDLGLMYFEMNSPEKAIDQYEKALKCTRCDTPGWIKASSYLNIGIAHYRKEDHKKARACFESAMDSLEEALSKKPPDNEKKPDNGEKFEIDMTRAAILNNRARIELDEENYRESEKSLKRAMKLYYEHIDEIESLVPLRSNAYKSSIAALHNNIGILYYKQGIYEAAKMEYERSLEYDKVARTYYNLGIIYHEEDKKSRAEKLMREALRLNPKFEEAKRYIGAQGSANWWEWWFGGTPKEKSPKGIAKNATEKGKFMDSIKERILCKRLDSIPKDKNNYPQDEEEKPRFMDLIKERVLCKRSVGIILIFLALFMLSSMTFESIFGYNEMNTTTKNIAESTTKVVRTTDYSLESRILVVALIIFLLVLPQIRSLGFKEVKLDMEPITKGSSKEGGYEYLAPKF
jgi:tetratricopeptide (TPR) repeat protein